MRWLAALGILLLLVPTTGARDVSLHPSSGLEPKAGPPGITLHYQVEMEWSCRERTSARLSEAPVAFWPAASTDASLRIETIPDGTIPAAICADQRNGSLVAPVQVAITTSPSTRQVEPIPVTLQWADGNLDDGIGIEEGALRLLVVATYNGSFDAHLVAPAVRVDGARGMIYVRAEHTAQALTAIYASVPEDAPIDVGEHHRAVAFLEAGESRVLEIPFTAQAGQHDWPVSVPLTLIGRSAFGGEVAGNVTLEVMLQEDAVPASEAPMPGAVILMAVLALLARRR